MKSNTRTKTKVLILNGVGSCGKSSISKALQEISVEPFLHIQMDTFLNALPSRYQNHPDGFAYETQYDGDMPVVVIKGGPVGERALRGMRCAIAVMASQGNNLIVDDVMLDNEDAEYAALLSPYDTRFIGVFASLEVLEKRERARGDRMLGLARWQFDRVHAGKEYDLQVDTSETTPQECARLIKHRFAL